MEFQLIIDKALAFENFMPNLSNKITANIGQTKKLH
jgi:hypothetical protein